MSGILSRPQCVNINITLILISSLAAVLINNKNFVPRFVLYKICLWNWKCAFNSTFPKYGFLWCILYLLLWSTTKEHIYFMFMMTSSNRNILRVTGHLCGEFTGHRWIPRTKASDAELWCLFDLRLNEWLSKQSWSWWFEMPSHTLWRQSNVLPSSPSCKGLINWTTRFVNHDARFWRIPVFRYCLISIKFTFIHQVCVSGTWENMYILCQWRNPGDTKH